MDAALQHQFAELERRHWWFQGRRKVLASVLRQHLRQQGPGSTPLIFDIGCGTGEMVDMLREFGSVWAMDASPEAVAYCRERFGPEVEVRLGSVPHDLPSPCSTQVVTAFDVIEHLDDDLEALRCIHVALVPGGTLVVTVPAFQFLWGPHDVLSHHRRRYTAARLRRRLEESGFVVDRLSYFNTWLFPVVAATRIGRRLTGEKAPRSDFRMPSRWLNRLLCGLFCSEGRMLRAGNLPFGVSILAVCTKSPDDGDDGLPDSWTGDAAMGNGEGVRWRWP